MLAEEDDLESRIGAERSLTWTFFRRVPDWMSPSSAPWSEVLVYS